MIFPQWLSELPEVNSLFFLNCNWGEKSVEYFSKTLWIPPIMLGLEPVILTDIKWQKKVWWLELWAALDACPSADTWLPLGQRWLIHCRIDSQTTAVFSQYITVRWKLISVNVNKLGWIWRGFGSTLITRSGVPALKVARAIREKTGEGEGINSLGCYVLICCSVCQSPCSQPFV